MSLTSWFEFAIIASLLLVYILMFRKHHVGFLSLASLIIITTLAPLQSIYLFILTFFMFAGARILVKHKSKLLLSLLALSLLCFLAYFKYAGLQLEVKSFLGMDTHFLSFIGVSYFTFKFWHVLYDVYAKKTEMVGFKEFFLYIYFFPTFLAGPIERIDHFILNTRQKVTFNYLTFLAGLERILLGLFKKLIIANFCATKTSLIFASAGTATPEALWFAAYLYSLQIYADFSGYTDIAVGISRLFGYVMVENFNKPYLQNNIATFWSSWHMSLTSWLREYVFYPVRKFLPKIVGENWLASSLARIINMLICGLWHGSGWNFLVWGLYHGFGLAVHRIFSAKVTSRSDFLKNNKGAKILATLFTFHFVTIGWIYFANDLQTANMIVLKLLSGINFVSVFQLATLCGMAYLFFGVIDSIILFGKKRKTLAFAFLILMLILMRSEQPIQDFIYSGF